MSDFKEANSLSNEELAQALDFADIINGWLKAVRGEAFKRASQKTGSIPGYMLAAGKASYEFREPEGVEIALAKLGLTRDDVYEEALVSPAKAKAKLKAKYKGKGHEQVWSEYDKLVRNVGANTTSLVRVTDPRDEVKRGHELKSIAEKYTAKFEDLL